jgi:hypothetical protein
MESHLKIIHFLERRTAHIQRLGVLPLGRRAGPGRGYDHNSSFQPGSRPCLLFWLDGGIPFDQVPYLRLLQPAFIEGTDRRHAVKGAGFRSGKGVGQIPNAVLVLIFSLIVAIIVAQSGIPDIAALVLIGIDVIKLKIISKYEVIPVLIHPYAVLVLSGIIGIDGIEMAAFGDLQAVVVAPGNISYDHIMAAVLLQG